MNIGIVGAGGMGAALGRLWAEKGHQVAFSFARDDAKLRQRAAQAGENARVLSASDAGQFGEVVMLAVPFEALEEALRQVGPLPGKIVVTCVSGLVPDFRGDVMGLPTQRTVSVAEQIAEALPQARVVEAFNSTFSTILAAEPSPFGAERVGIFLCGDDAEAKTVAAGLIADCGCDAVDAGPLHTARSLETLASAWVQFAAASGLFPMLGLKPLLPA